MFWCRIFFCKHDKLPLKDRQEHHVLMANDLMMTSQCRCTRPLSQSYIAMHTLFGSESNMAVNAGRVVMFHQQVKLWKWRVKQDHPLKIISPIWWWRSKETGWVNSTMFLWLTSWSWCQNAGAWDLSKSYVVIHHNAGARDLSANSL